MKVLLMDPLEELFRSEHDRLWKSLVAFSGDPDIAAEAESETFSQALARGDKLYDPQAWVWRSAFKIAAGLLAERRLNTPDSGALGTIGAVSTMAPDPQIDTPLVDFLDQLQTLSEQQRTVVVLRYAGGFMPTEIAELLDTTPGTIRVQLHRAHEHLRERIGES